MESLQEPKAVSAPIEIKGDVEGMVSGVSRLQLSDAEPEVQGNSRNKLHDSKRGFRFWPLLRSFVDACLFHRTLSNYCGMHQEAIYALEQAEKAARSIGSQGLLGKILVSKSEIASSSGDHHESWKCLEEASPLYKSADDSLDVVLHHRSLGNFYHREHQWKPEVEAYAQAELVLDRIFASASRDYSAIECSTVSTNAGKTTLSMDGGNGKRMPQKPPGQRKPLRSARSKPKEETRILPSPSKGLTIQTDDWPSLEIVRSDILRRKAENAIAQHRYAEAAVLLLDTVPHYLPAETTVRLHAALASLRIREGISHMAGDAVFGMLPESTLSYPATSALGQGQSEGSANDRNGNTKPRKPQSRVQPGSKADLHPRLTISMPFVDRLLEALSLATDIHSDVLEKCSNFTVYKVCASLGTAAMLLASTRSDVALGRVESLMIPYTIGKPYPYDNFSLDLLTLHRAFEDERSFQGTAGYRSQSLNEKGAS